MADDAVARLVLFGRILRGEGMAVGTDRIEAFCSAAAVLAPDDLYWAGRATLVSRHEDIPVYDRAFHAFFGSAPQAAPPRARARVEVAARPSAINAPTPAEPAGETSIALASQVEVLRRKSFSRCTPDELAALTELMTRLRVAVPLRRSRRRAPARGGAPDLRRTLRRSFRSGGEPLERAWRSRLQRRRRLVLVLDVSGSMSEYSRALLIFAHAVLRTDRRWEAFCFGTRLTRITRALSTADADAALRRAAEEVFDWEGGTRIGDSLKAFLDRFGRGAVARGAVVVVCSDGLEVGDPALLAEQMARLARLAHRVIWLNPLKGDPAYEPLARGMQAALPHIDVFTSGHNLVSLEELGRELGRA
ncbi:MAG: VWA domain-containing protein [Actinomycetota bacterium]|nr:VWA domain-containing protein [Actinomycetota bacterium]